MVIHSLPPEVADGIGAEIIVVLQQAFPQITASQKGMFAQTALAPGIKRGNGTLVHGIGGQR